MANDVMKWKQGDTGLSRVVTLLGNDGNPAVLVGAQVRWQMTTFAGTAVIDKAATIVDTATGQIALDRVAGDTAVPGRYLAEIRVTYGDGDVQWFPGDGYIEVHIFPTLIPA